jgi:aryl-alcohol dehydrogenase-like predicted oxidoreductase
MDRRPLGAAGPLISPITFGAWAVGGGMGKVEEATAIATIQRALDRGITAIDTAEYYRVSEAVIGHALVGRARESVFLATKVSFGPYTRARVNEALENSLRALRTDYVDLYQLHDFPTDVPFDETFDALDEARASGRTHYVGVSGFTLDQMARAASRPIQSLQTRLNIFDAEAVGELLPYCAARGIGVMGHSTLAKGLLTGKYRAGHRFPTDDERSALPRFQGDTFAQYLALADLVATIVREKGVTLTQLAIAWSLAQPGVTTCNVGARTPEQVDEHVGALGVRLGADDLARIERVVGRGERATDLGGRSRTSDDTPG